MFPLTRPRSILERFTNSTIPPPRLQERYHLVKASESLMSIANREYNLQEYDPDRWRDIGSVNGVENPILFGLEYLGQRIRIPAPALPDFV